MSTRAARWISWSFVGLYFLLLGVGLVLQLYNGVTFEAGTFPFPVLVILLAAVGGWAAL